MKKLILMSCLLFSNSSILNANATETPNPYTIKNTKISMYADYFGFSNVGKYLQFSKKINRMMDGYVPEQLANSLLEEPLWLEYKATIEQGKVPSELEKAKLTALLLERKQVLLEYVGIEDGQYKYFDRFVDFANSDQRYSTSNTQSDKTGEISTFSTQDTITVYCDDLCERQIRADDIYKGLLIWDMASRSGVENWREFVVSFPSSSTAELWKGNDFSGAWKIKSLDGSALCKYSPGACDL